MAEVPLPTPTDNPVPSTDIRDAVYAGAMLDKVVTSTELTYTDRLGGEHYTIDGIKEEGDKVVEETRQNLIPLSRQYMTLAAAQADIANIPEGSTTYYRSPDDSALAIEVMNVGGTLTATGRTMLSEQGVDDKIDARLVPGPYRSSNIPLFHDANDMVPLWLKDGLPDAAGFGPNLRSEVAAIPNQWAQQYLVQMSYSTRYFPLFHDRNGNVPIWLKNGLLDGAGFGPGLLGVITALIESAPGAAGHADKYFIPGDQYKFIFKRGLIFNGENTSLNVVFTGDSWTEANTIPQSMINVLGGTSKDPGWISCSTRASSVMSGITLSRSGFTQYDGDNENGNASPLYGSGPDGIALYNTGTASWIMWSGVKATDLTLFYYDGTGSFDIVIDGTTTATITGGNTGKALTHVISGLTSSTHTVRVQAPGDGVVSILGMYGKDSGNPRGVTVSRMGNSGAMASDYLFWKDWIAPVASYLDIDMLFIILGTNDFRKSAGTAEYENGIQTIIDKYKAATPGICICLISPAQGNATGTPALEEYDSSMRKLAVNNGVSFISGYQIFPKSYSNANGAWQDNLHLSSKGATVLTSTIKNHFFQE
ncbi:TPA: SGNH/GDSL hydrolase family protein [Klebsiella pneumoniae]|nr:SGNH/GDSL hydrolase family protein [Klebsiella pneumoniae]